MFRGARLLRSLAHFTTVDILVIGSALKKFSPLCIIIVFRKSIMHIYQGQSARALPLSFPELMFRAYIINNS